MKGKIICYNMKSSNLSRRDVDKFLRELIGHNDKSHHGRYSYRKQGILDEIPHIKPVRSVIVVPKKESPQVIDLLKKYAIDTYIRDIILTKCDLKTLDKKDGKQDKTT